MVVTGIGVCVKGKKRERESNGALPGLFVTLHKLLLLLALQKPAPVKFAKSNGFAFLSFEKIYIEHDIDHDNLHFFNFK